MRKELQLLGLTKNESIVYEVLVKNGPCKAGEVINKGDLHRNLVYRALDALVTNGYATKVVRNGVWHFQITEPESLLTSMRRKEQLFAEVLKEITLHKKTSGQQIVVYEGVESFRRYWLESLKRAPVGTVNYVAGGELKSWSNIMGPAFKKYQQLVKEKQISYKTIYFGLDADEALLIKELYGEHNKNAVRVWDTDISFFGNFNIFNDTVILHTHDMEPRIIEIRDPSLLLLFKGYFDLMWEKAEVFELN